MTSVNITVSDQSPTWEYSPEREGASSSGWSSDFSPEPPYDPTHASSNLASGVSSHTTTLSGATARLSFVGTAVSIYGAGTSGAYSTTLDNGPEDAGNPSGSLLATYGALNGSVMHTITLKATQGQSLTLSHAEFAVRSNIASNSISNSTVVAVTAGPNNTFTTNSFFSTTGTGIANFHQDAGYTRIDTNGAGSTLEFSCSKTSALFVYGTSNWDHQTYSVELNPPGASRGARIFNATSKWFVLDNLVYFESGLDPAQTYNIKMTNLIQGSYLDIHSVLMMNLPPLSRDPSSSGSPPPSTSNPSLPSTSKSSNTGQIVGIAVGAVVIVAALLLFGVLCLRRRSRKRAERDAMSMNGMLVTPFDDQSHSQMTPAQSNSLSSTNMMTVNSDNQYAAYRDGYTYSTYSASTRDVPQPPQVPYSDDSSTPRTSGDFDPYSDGRSMRPPQQPFASGTASIGASMIASASSSASASRIAGPLPEKHARMPSDDGASSRRIRQEVDAGRVVPEEEALPPTYDPNWSRH
ncbi:hypothetical protein MIND_00753100 [Mycena indigotica]|uniref:Transmembrane protein n=1 Tax=Mycena indigotica TaxID=2126181 RepID=A0A8H6SP91_9AGAR|nr:uncharacterized protein MIND_00753100 [Mycena indigotica]KAF7301872.1 hypothetical protein MIND_00753100 [Mycena indigotica]